MRSVRTKRTPVPWVRIHTTGALLLVASQLLASSPTYAAPKPPAVLVRCWKRIAAIVTRDNGAVPILPGQLHVQPLPPEYASFNTDLFDARGVTEGQHGGMRIVVQRKAAWHDMRKDFSQDGHDLTQDLRAYPAALGGKEAEYFGYRILNKGTVTVPDRAELTGAIAGFNEGLAEGDPRRIQISVYSLATSFVEPDKYVHDFADHALIPISHNGKQFYHDISSHALEGFFTHNSLVEVMRERSKLWLDFIEYGNSHSMTPNQRRIFERLAHRGLLRLTSQIDRLGMGMANYVRPEQDLYLWQVGKALLKEAPELTVSKEKIGWNAVMAGHLRAGGLPSLTNDADAFFKYGLYDPEEKEDWNPALLSLWDEFSTAQNSANPQRYRILPFDLGAQLDQVDGAMLIKEPEKREEALGKIELSRPFVQRLHRLRELMRARGER